ncbi:ribonuclease P protein component [Candidatus Peregrinibacteria bacterium]|jgi:ribonuclease P protein component|nr:ribonuclease P protein component [Candidatus Peregrinibacteria bacterium]MBT4056003.1 ribonuclease P protein component [Candidatus Peregrinibacteria bacterium]
MIPTSNRLKRNQVEYVLKKGLSTSTDLFVVRYIEHKDDEKPHFTIITSTKLSKKAVERNKLKRKIYEAVRLQMPEKLPLYIAIIPKKQALEVKYEKIAQDIAKLFKKLT